MEQESIAVRLRNTFIDDYGAVGPTIVEHPLIRSASDGSLSGSSTSGSNKFTFWIPSLSSSSASSSKPPSRSKLPQELGHQPVLDSAAVASSSFTPIYRSQPSYAQSPPSVPLWSAAGPTRPEDLSSLLAFADNSRSAASVTESLPQWSNQQLPAQLPTFPGQACRTSAASASTQGNINTEMILLRAQEAELMQNFQTTMWQQQLEAQVQLQHRQPEIHSQPPLEQAGNNPQPVQMTKQDKPRTGIASAGSAKHPDRCSPCLFYFKRICNKGTSCHYCHYIHEGQKNVRIRPSKKTRTVVPDGGVEADSSARDMEAQA